MSFKILFLSGETEGGRTVRVPVSYPAAWVLEEDGTYKAKIPLPSGNFLVPEDVFVAACDIDALTMDEDDLADHAQFQHR